MSRSFRGGSVPFSSPDDWPITVTTQVRAIITQIQLFLIRLRLVAVRKVPIGSI